MKTTRKGDKIMIKILIAITLLLIVAIVRLAMSCYRKARDVDYWRKAAQDQRQENSEAETNIDRLEREITQTNKAMADHHQCQQKIIDKLTQEVEEGKASLTQADKALRIISAAARGAMEYKDATIVALQSEITILKDRLSHPVRRPPLKSARQASIYAALPHSFTRAEANVIATSQGYSIRALTSFLANRRVFAKVHEGKYQKVRHG